VDEVWFVLVKLNVFELREVVEGVIPKLKLVERNTIHKQRQLYLAKVVSRLLQCMVAPWIHFLGASHKHNVESLIVCKVAFPINSHLVVVIQTVQVF